MVWNGVFTDFSRLAGSGGRERSDLRVVVFGDVGRDSLHGAHYFWGGSSCGLCGGDFKQTSLEFIEGFIKKAVADERIFCFEIV